MSSLRKAGGSAGDEADAGPPLAFGSGGRRSPQRGNFFDDLSLDLRYGVRQLARRPAFTMLVVLTLAVGIGPNVAIFSIMKGLVLRSLPYPEPERVVAVWQTEISWRGYMPLSTHAYDALREGNNSFEELGVYEPYYFNFRDEDEPLRVSGVACTASVLRALGMEPARGRLFTGSSRPANGDIRDQAIPPMRSRKPRARTLNAICRPMRMMTAPATRRTGPAAAGVRLPIRLPSAATAVPRTM
jgi:hypothetical protein